jgi:hypothetical protein
MKIRVVVAVPEKPTAVTFGLARLLRLPLIWPALVQVADTSPKLVPFSVRVKTVGW